MLSDLTSFLKRSFRVARVHLFLIIPIANSRSRRLVVSFCSVTQDSAVESRQISLKLLSAADFVKQK